MIRYTLCKLAIAIVLLVLIGGYYLIAKDDEC